MKHLFVCAALTLSAGTVVAGAPPRPLVPLWSSAEITRQCDTVLSHAAALQATMEARKAPNGIFAEWNRLQVDLEDVMGPVYLLANVHPDKVVRDAGDGCVLRLTRFSTDLYQSEALYRRIQAARPTSPHQAKLKQDLIDGFEDTGVTLAPEQRGRAKAIIEKLEDLRQAYERNVRDDKTRVVLPPADLRGMPEDYIKALTRDADGNYLLGLDYPTYHPFVTNAASGEARRKYWMAKQREGGEGNLQLLDQIMQLRVELARLYGLSSYGEYSIRRKMAETPENVNRFLAEVRGAVRDVEKRDLEELRQEKAAELGTPLAETRLFRWDIPYYQERIKRARYSIDQEALRQYFPVDKSIAFAVLLAEQLYGVKIKPVEVPVWHNEVKYYEVQDARSGRYLSGFYLDLHSRDGKYGHAAAFPVRAVSTLARRTPLTVLVANFNRKGFDHGELEVFLHEMGHVLHGVLSTAEFNNHGGTATMVDFVEAPSQMFEEWARREQTLALFKQVCAECPQLGADQIRRLDAARRYGKGIYYARQWQLARFDMDLTAARPEPALEAWKRIENDSPIPHVEGSMFPASFAHIAGGYAAGYYGYMWSQVMALDMLSAFGSNLLDAKVGKRYRDTILANGGQVNPAQLVKAFLGREPNSKAFYAEITGTR